MLRALATITNLFPFWVLAAGVLALFQPAAFTWFSGPWVVWGLAVIMLGMGLTLTFQDFKAVGRFPRGVALGLGAQFIIMPGLAWALGRTMGLEPGLAAGLILLGCCPGGTASNVIAYLARANLALSVVMTMCSTFAGIVLTPLLTAWLAGAIVEVDAAKMFLDMVKIVVAPVVLGLLLNQFAGKAVKKVQPVAPLISVIAIVLIVGSVVGANAAHLRSGGAWKICLAVILLHGGGFLLGYFGSRLLRFDPLTARTVSIETGMQNSGLGVALARKHFPDPLAALPGAIASVFQSLIGSLLAGYWRWRSAKGS